MSFVRPEVAAALTRYQGVLIAGGVLALGAWWVLLGNGVMGLVGGLTLLAGACLMIAAVQRLRFDAGRGGPGIVQIDEAAIGYFGPLTGGVVAMSELSALRLDRTGSPVHWVLSQPGQDDVMIPVTAAGAEGLLGPFASLPGMRTEHLLSELRKTGGGDVLIWERGTGDTARITHHAPH
ncbi:hypothetical protein KUD11_02780 [Roseovarius sp. LXJ103]|uniref:hypothetical protein n=1 Tax=Roseovarius carneus TaxID=2853164 RepID=UPI000D6108DB|nr:hypothetical protein [Roseovarius carneus]MBZ8117565.1 hypothetical protein [Roseovarius carneus]PWE36642.1 hypothetical protein DD563_12160 [Pelagicola sp. LXJ1103]